MTKDENDIVLVALWDTVALNDVVLENKMELGGDPANVALTKVPALNDGAEFDAELEDKAVLVVLGEVPSDSDDVEDQDVELDTEAVLVVLAESSALSVAVADSAMELDADAVLPVGVLKTMPVLKDDAEVEADTVLVVPPESPALNDGATHGDSVSKPDIDAVVAL